MINIINNIDLAAKRKEKIKIKENIKCHEMKVI